MAKSTVAIVLRIIQIICAILVVTLGAVSISKLYSLQFYPTMGIICGFFALVFYVPLVTPPVRSYPPWLVLFGEIFTFCWWIVAVGLIAYLFGAVSCDFSSYYYGYYYSDDELSEGCKVGKGQLGIAGVGLFFSLVTLVLLVIYSIVPASRNSDWTDRDYFLVGGIFPKYAAEGRVSAGVYDPESTVGSK